MFRRKHWKLHNLYSSKKKEVTRIDRNEEKIAKNKCYILQFIERFMAILLSNFINNFSEEVCRIKCKHRHDEKDVGLMELSLSIAIVFLNIQISKII